MSTRRRVSAGADRRRLARGGRRASDGLGRYPTVLIADSHDGARRTCADYLARFGFSVAEAVDGIDLMARVVIAPPRIILTESHLPSLPQSGLLQWLRRSSWTREIPVILMAPADHVDLAGTPRTVGVLFRPFALEAMLKEVRRLLQTTERRQSHEVKTES